MSNKGKYQTGNPLKRKLLTRFLARASTRISATSPKSVLDVGTGEGLFWAESGLSAHVVGIDVRRDALLEARGVGNLHPVRASARSLPFADSSFDLVVAMEILEHLDRPSDAIAELSRVTRSDAFITVPWEPWFSLGVLFGSGAHWRRLGREPEHINAFGPNDIHALVEAHFADVRVSTCAPWLIVEASSPVAGS
jgi:SAM-dependent methyltransferase